MAGAGFQSPLLAQPETGPEEVLAAQEICEILWACLWVIDESGVSTDPAKVEAVSKMTTADLMESPHLRLVSDLFSEW